jgi:hypothetical protein
MDGLAEPGMNVPDPWELLEQDVFLPLWEIGLAPDPLAALPGDVERGIEDVIQLELGIHADAVSRSLDMAESSFPGEQGRREFPLPDRMLDRVEEDSENKLVGTPEPETCVEVAGDHGWFYPTPDIDGDGPAVPGGEETVGRPPRPFGSGPGLRMAGGAAGAGPEWWCPVNNQASSIEICRECEFYNEDADSENGLQCGYFDES